jgi:hypothetical protein
VTHGVSEFCRRRALELYPQLARAVPPKDIGRPRRQNPLRLGKFPHCVENCFWRWHQEEHVLREPNDVSALVGPVIARGYCLHPLRTDGSVMFFDPTLPAQHGDVVLFQLSEPGTAWGADRTDFQSKLLIEFADEYFLAFNEGMFPLGDIRILGVEVRNPHRANCAQGRTYDAAQPQRGHGSA